KKNYIMTTKKQSVSRSTIEQLRDIRDKVSAETQNMAFAELKQYINKHLNSSSLHSNAVWH
ncbi:hypothetical protein, partial [Candidatus Symbiothrix dinenymphae]|uniref:hypothetical protein n=1 Tax=Candidatus Symbiothrix dinenymphae TaxID=467085 RepID=UPI000A6B88D8